VGNNSNDRDSVKKNDNRNTQGQDPRRNPNPRPAANRNSVAGDRRPQGQRPQGQRPQGQRPQGQRPQGQRPASGQYSDKRMAERRMEERRYNSQANSKKKKKKKNKGLKVLLGFFWAIFILFALGFIAIFLHNNGIVTIPFLDRFASSEESTTGSDNPDIDKDYTGEDNTEKIVTRYEYETNANLDINALVTDYFNALSGCDKEKLQSLVVDPSQFDDMSVYETKATIITDYSNTNCYTIKGYNENDTVCYALSNITISGISSTPLDIVRFYIVYKDGTYLIDNTKKSSEVASYIDSINSSTDIQGLYKLVKDDITKCQQEDADFYEFYQKLMN